MALFPFYFGTHPNRRFGFINPTGKIVIEPQFSGAGSFSEGIAIVGIEGRPHFLNESGELTMQPSCDIAHPFKNGHSHCRSGSKHQYINKSGEIVLEHTFRDSYDVSEGYVPVMRDICDYALISLNGQVLCESSNRRLEVSEGKLACEDLMSGLYGFKSPNGMWMISPQYLFAWPFSEGLAAVAVKLKRKKIDLVQFIDRKNEVVIAPSVYSSTGGRFRNGRAQVWKTVKRKDKSGFIDQSGNEIIPCIFDLTQEFAEGLVAAKMNERWGYLDLQGHEVTLPRFDFAGSFRNGLAQVIEAGFPAYIDKSGAVVWRGDERVYEKSKPLSLAWAG